MVVGNLREGGEMAPFYRFFLVSLLLYSVVMKSSSAANSGGAQFMTQFMTANTSVGAIKKPGVLSRLNEGMGADFWNEKVLGRVFDDWKLTEGSSAGKEALKNFTRAGTLAGYVNFVAVEAIHLPLPINFIFVGFDGDGSQGFKLGEDELERWFKKIDHIVEYTRVPQLEEALTPFYRVKGSGERQHHRPFISYSHYNYSVQGIGLNSKVSAVFERAIKLLSRKDNSSDGSQWQVDVNGISHIFRSLVNYLELEKAYNIFVLNPKRDPAHGSYGYRAGLSKSEIELFQSDAEKRDALLKGKVIVRDFLAEVDEEKNPLQVRHPLFRFSWVTAEVENTASWADKLNGALDSIQDALRSKSEEEVTFWFARLILKGNDGQLATALRRALKEGEGLRAECLVDTWVGDDRFSFVDLSAGPFTWGPTVGGDGIRSELSLPSVDSSFNEEVDTAAVQDEFESLWQDRFAFLGDENGRFTVEMLLAEVEVYKLFTDKHCEGRRIGTQFCGEFQERLNAARDELLKVESEDAGKKKLVDLPQNLKAVELLKKFDEGNIFGFGNQRTVNFSVTRDEFLAHLGAVLSSSMRHVVTPSGADGAFHYYESVHFQVFFITEDEVKHDGLLPVDRDAIKAALSRLILPSQRAIYDFPILTLAEDHALGMAFACAKRATVVPMLLANGTYKTADRMYLDSLILQHHIKQIFNLEDAEKGFDRRSTIQVPLFWFLHTGVDALLVDKHYQARALPDMVIVVQSQKHAAWESHLQCNGESILWDLRQPAKAAIAAVAEHMGGLVPSHVSFSQAHENAIQDWLWSVGAHPFSSTSAGWHVLQSHSDALARSYIVTALDESIEIVNSGVQLLANERPQAATFTAFRAHEQSLRYSYNQVVRLWKQIAGFHEELKYGDALKLLFHLENSAENFYSKANETVAAVHPVYCMQHRKLELRMDVAAVLSIVVLLICLSLTLRPKARKPKIN